MERQRENEDGKEEKLYERGKAKEPEQDTRGARPEESPQKPEATAPEKSEGEDELKRQSSPGIRQEREEQVITRGRHWRRKSLKVPNPASDQQREQKEDPPGKVPKRERAGGQGLKERTPKKRKHKRQIPGRNTTRKKRTLQTKGAEERTENKVGRELMQDEAKNNTQHRAERSDLRGRVREGESGTSTAGKKPPAEQRYMTPSVLAHG